MGPTVQPDILHASAIAFGPAQGLLILGASGSGKSTLALQLIGLGAVLVADDRTRVVPRDGALWMSSPDPITGQIEARGFGLLRTPAKPAIARAVVHLDQSESERLPPARETVIAGVSLPLFWRVESPAFPAMLKLWLLGERSEGV